MIAHRMSEKMPRIRARVFARLVAICVVVAMLGTPLVLGQPAAPTPIFPAEGASVVVPTFSWQAPAGAVSYEVEVGSQSNPLVVYWSGTTFLLTLTPNDANPFPNEPLYWRVRAYDSDNVAGPWSGRINFTKYIPAPELVSPADGVTITQPSLEWQPAAGAVRYKVELSTVPTFIPVAHTYSTYNTRLTPDDTIATATFYWRVTGVDSDGHEGTPSPGRRFTLEAAPPPSQTVPLLLTPAAGAILTADPTFRWTPVIGAAYYRLRVSTDPAFGSTYDSVSTDYTSYTPYTAGTRDTYANGTYYWKVEARDNYGNVIATSEARSFTKQMALPLKSPAPGATLTRDPDFEWEEVVGAHYYRLRVSTDPAFGSTYDTVSTDYTSYTPYTPGSRDIYANGTYYWKVEARDYYGNVIATSEARSFTKEAVLSLLGPADHAVLRTTPTFSWTQVLGAHYYRLRVSTDPAFGSTYDTVSTDYTSYTPYTPGSRDIYANGTYYWKVEARDYYGNVIATSEVRSFTLSSRYQVYLPLVMRSKAGR